MRTHATPEDRHLKGDIIEGPGVGVRPELMVVDPGYVFSRPGVGPGALGEEPAPEKAVGVGANIHQILTNHSEAVCYTLHFATPGN